jgi:sodium-dependent dicarboxylate transporter 2/3/5
VIQIGLADILGKSILSLLEPLGPLGLAAGAYLLTALLTQFLGGQVTAFVTGPVTISAAIHMGANPQAIAVATAIGCSASFLLPMAHPVNIIMIAPANYKFIDFFRAGWLLSILCFLMLLVGLSVFWGL